VKTEEKVMSKPKIFIIVKGGLVQSVWCNNPGTEVAVIDHDILNHTDDEDEQAYLEEEQKEFETAQGHDEIYLVY
jgi:hypothetical protein